MRPAAFASGKSIACACAEWPILPTRSGLLCAPPALGRMLNAVRGGASGAQAVYALLSKLGCEVLSDAFPVLLPAACTIADVDGVGVVSVLARICDQQRDTSAHALAALSDEERRTLLRFIARFGADYSEEDLARLRTVPLFELASGGGGGAGVHEATFVALKSEQWYALPEGMGVAALLPEQNAATLALHRIPILRSSDELLALFRYVTRHTSRGGGRAALLLIAPRAGDWTCSPPRP